VVHREEHGRTSASSVESPSRPPVARDSLVTSNPARGDTPLATGANRWKAVLLTTFEFEPPQGGDTLRQRVSPPCGGFSAFGADGDHGFAPVASGVSPLRGSDDQALPDADRSPAEARELFGWPAVGMTFPPGIKIAFPAGWERFLIERGSTFPPSRHAPSRPKLGRDTNF